MAEAKEEKLLQACEDGDLELIRQLVKEGCNPRDVRDRDLVDETPLHKACRYVLYVLLPPLYTALNISS